MSERYSARTASATSEQVLCQKPCRVWGVRPELTTTGTLTLRNDSAANGAAGAIKHVCAIGLTQAGKDLDGALFDKGLTIQQSVASDLCHVTWEPV